MPGNIHSDLVTGVASLKVFDRRSPGSHSLRRILTKVGNSVNGRLQWMCSAPARELGTVVTSVMSAPNARSMHRRCREMNLASVALTCVLKRSLVTRDGESLYCLRTVCSWEYIS
jgi:hypothetical protein